MSDWKSTDYGAPKTWKEIQREKRETELEKVSASPVPILLLIVLLSGITVACFIALLVFFLR